jgi:ArsR family transcriptional regulator, arsenate/arsenite/antimonite-responsive transcriptional repressor
VAPRLQARRLFASVRSYIRQREYMNDTRLDYICQGKYNGLVKDKRLDALETVFKALADRTRLRILGLLAAGEVCVCDIHESLGLPQPTTSRHLAYLRRAGLVATRKQGLWVHYRLADLPDPVTRTVVEAVSHAIGHVAAAERDRHRLAQRIPALAVAGSTESCCAPGAAPRACCATD